MTPKQIANKRIRLTDKIRQLYYDLEDLKKNCGHKNAVYTDGADTGNWCKSDDSYWTDMQCPDCGATSRTYHKG